jgi:hypothetical protein
MPNPDEQLKEDIGNMTFDFSDPDGTKVGEFIDEDDY